MKSKQTLRSIVVLAALSVLGIFVLGGGPAAASTLHPLTVTATASSSCSWTISKSGPTHLTLAVNEGFDVPYSVSVAKTCATFDVAGTVSGPGSPDSVSVTLSDGGANTNAVVSGCATDGTTFTCNYDGHPTSGVDGTVSALASYGGGSDTSTGSTPYSFQGITPAEDTVDVLDSNLDTPLAVHLGHSATFNYTVHVSFPHCGHYSFDNTATVRDGTVLATSTATVGVDVPCSGGCTLTQGYWKTHSKYGPAPSDATWNLLLPSGPDTTFFLSGQTWYQSFNTSPSGGNVYYILAHQYMAARLNMLAGASSTTAVNTSLSWATTFFNTYTPAQIGALKGSDPLRAAANANATTLESYNTGATGPGHCSE